MNIIDFSIIGALTISCIISLMRGFIKEVVSLVSWLLAFTLSISYAEKAQQLFAGSIHNVTVRFGLSLALIFIFVLLIGAIINKILGYIVTQTGFGAFDKIIGLFFGFIRGVLLICIVIFFAMMTSVEHAKLWKRSELIPHFIAVIDWLDIDNLDLPRFDPDQLRLSSNELDSVEDQLNQ